MEKKRSGGYLPMKNLLLRTLATTGLISATLVAPHLLVLIKKLDRAAARRKNLYRNIDQALRNLSRNGYIKMSGTRGQRFVELTRKGAGLVESLFAAEYRIPEPAFWNGKWHILVFDMSERRRKARNQLRTLLANAGFVRLQDSVWVYPYPCDEFVQLVRMHLRSGTGELQYFVAEALQSDKALREHFNLP